MIDTSSASPDPLRAWREATRGSGRPPGGGEAAPDDERPRVAPHRLTRLVVLTGAACVAALGLAGLAAGRAGTMTQAVTPAPGSAHSPATAVATPPPAQPQALPTVPGDLAAAAVLAVRSAAPRTRYVDTAVAEDAHSVGDVTVVTVRALVLHATRDGWDAGRPARYAVAVGRSAGQAAALGRPWALAPPAEAAAEVTWQPVDDTILRDHAADAITAQGYRLQGPPRLHASAALPGLYQARVRALGPTDDRAADHQVWVRADDGSVVGAATAPGPALPGPRP